MLITDGAPVYQAAFRRLGIAGILVQQVHSYPWKNVLVTQFELAEKSMKLLQIELPFDVFTKATPSILKARTFSRNYFRSGTRKKVRSAAKKSARKPPRKSARKQKWSKFQVCPQLKMVDLRAPGTGKLPDKRAIEALLELLFVIFSGKAIQSNRIESVNSQVKQFVNTCGLKTFEHLENRVRLFLAYHLGFVA